MSSYRKPLLLVAAALAVLVAVATLPLLEWASVGINWVDAHKNVAWALFIATYIVATVLILPGSVLTLAAGFVFGLPIGTALVSVGSVIGATAAFLVGRFLARDWVEQRIADLPRFRALDEATRKDGFLIVLLVRLSPLFPFNLTNYGLGLTGVSFREFVIASWIGMLPGTVMYVYVGSLAQNVAQLTTGSVETGAAGRALLIGGFAATVALTVLITRRATRALRARLHLDV